MSLLSAYSLRRFRFICPVPERTANSDRYKGLAESISWAASLDPPPSRRENRDVAVRRAEAGPAWSCGTTRPQTLEVRMTRVNVKMENVKNIVLIAHDSCKKDLLE